MVSLLMKRSSKMNRFWKWFLIVLGILLLIGISFAVALFFFRGGPVRMHTGAFIGRPRVFGGMMVGMGGLMLFRFLIPIGILVLAGFGIAYFVKIGKKPVQPVIAVTSPVLSTCAYCGKPLSAEWTTCPYCGNKIEAPTETTPKA
jgi:hypothetical protein